MQYLRTLALLYLSAIGAVLLPGIAAARGAGVLQFAIERFAVDGDLDRVTVVVTRSGGSQGAVSVAYQRADGTATAGVDYVPASGTFAWADGDIGVRSLDLSLSHNGAAVGNRKFEVVLSTPSGGAVLGDRVRAQVRIEGFESGAGGVLRFRPEVFGTFFATVGLVEAVAIDPWLPPPSEGRPDDDFERDPIRVVVERTGAAHGEASVRFSVGSARDVTDSFSGGFEDLGAAVYQPVGIVTTLLQAPILVADEGTADRLLIRVAIDHQRLGDLLIALQTPDGDVVRLLDRPGRQVIGPGRQRFW